MHQRDEPSEAKPSYIDLGTYHIEQIAIIERDIENLKNLSIEDARKASVEEYIEEKLGISKKIAELIDLEAKYRDMLASVDNWQVPTKEHNGLKEFMIDQINESIKFDCALGFWQNRLVEIEVLSGADWIADKLKEKRAQIRYHKSAHESEILRCKRQHEWINALYNSLPEE